MKHKCLESIRNTAVFNKGMGTVTIPYDAYFLMHRDSLYLDLMKQAYEINEEKKATEYVRHVLAGPLVGTGYKKAVPPMTDIEAISYLYGLPEEYVRNYLWEGEEC